MFRVTLLLCLGGVVVCCFAVIALSSELVLGFSVAVVCHLWVNRVVAVRCFMCSIGLVLVVIGDVCCRYMRVLCVLCFGGVIACCVCL